MSKARCKHFAKHTSMKQYKSTGAEERWNIFMNRGWSYWQEVAPALGRDSTEIPSRPGAIQEDDGPCWTIWCSALSQASHVCLPVSSEDLKVNFRTLLPCYLYLYFFFFECGLSHSQWVLLANSCSSAERTPQGIVIFKHLNWVDPEHHWWLWRFWPPVITVLAGLVSVSVAVYTPLFSEW